MADWRHGKNTLASKCKFYWEQNVESHGDVLFLVGSEEQKVNGFKFPLILMSPVFEDMFQKTWSLPRDQEHIKLPHVDPIIFRNFLQLLLKDTVTTENLAALKLSMKDIRDLSYLSKEYRVQTLHETIGEYLKRNTLVENVLKINENVRGKDEKKLDSLNAVSNIPEEDALSKIMENITSDDPQKQFHGVRSARKILSQTQPPIDLVIAAGIVPRCVEFLQSSNYYSNLRFEAAWVLTNIASGTSEQTKVVVEAGAVPSLIQMLGSPHAHMTESAIWALGNIVGDGPHFRDYVVQNGIIPHLVTLSRTSTSAPFLRNVARTLSNICCNKHSPPPSEATTQCIPALVHLIGFADTKVVADACWALSYLCGSSNELIDEIINAGVVPRLVQLLDSEDISVVTPCLKAVGNIVTGNDLQTRVVLKAGVLSYLKKLLQSINSSVVKEAVWTISNITAKRSEQISLVIQANIVPHLIQVMRSGDLRSQKKAVLALTNITSGGSLEHMVYLCQEGIVPIYFDLMSIGDWKTIIVVMEGLENILKGADEAGQVDELVCFIKEFGGLEKLQSLLSHNNIAVYEKAYSIIDNFFSKEDQILDDMTLLPKMDSSGHFVLSTVTRPEQGYNF